MRFSLLPGPWYHRWLGILPVMILLAVVGPSRADAAGIRDKVEKPVAASVDIRQATQKHEEQWRDDREKRVARFEQLESRKKELSTRRDALAEVTRGYQERIAEKQRQLAKIEEMQARIIPLVAEQIQALRNHVENDLPYLAEERRRRLERLDEVRSDPQVAVSEKFRKVMEALLVEAEYGNTIEVYQQTLPVDGQDMLVQVFRLGRIALFYQTLDQKRCGFYDVAASAWQALPNGCNRAIQTAMDIGAKRRPAELLTLPLGRLRIR